ncbi:flagellar basal-body MS-ring/collar protein FliF [Methylococcus sp. EFPC2]|uniref:flagellar basal-body MS-ring/collar protein FliF n=1 Tax=Methylococcus sp. EFPC2 TaxID=2812648 RepID=UPI0019682177|nr:flagellar basal-body MS-ring/collar protein FliF [Methylococcus sp. EFPC2]QSA98542.1 flagellar M-ring protein FliF [Methylococcus sp. EFPC2]
MELAETATENDPAGKRLATTASAQTKGGENLPAVARNFMQMPRNRQIATIVAAALSLAIIVAMALWSNRTEYDRLFGAIPQKDAGEIVEALKKLNVDYRLDAATGTIQVPADRVHELRLKLATQGLPRETDAGFELLNRESSFGSSQMMETARFQHALEGEIAHSIMTLRNVKSARVHLALPKESVFVRNPRKPSASVVLELGSGYGLEPGQVEGIVHLVAASVPQLEPGQVTVVDQRGHLFNSADSASGVNLNAKQFDYKKQVEDHLIDRVENILSPVVGRDGLRTQVAADVDFTETERTQELYNPDLPALRSEQTQEEQSRNKQLAQGIPGALSNQPPPAGQAPEVAPGQPVRPQAAQGAQPAGAGQGAAAQTASATPEAINQSKSATRNYELDKTISHTRLSSGGIRRLTVAVVVDHQRIPQADGSYTSQPYSDEDLTRFTSLVKEAVGYDAARGDRVTVTNAAFRNDGETVAVKPWEEPWFWSTLKYTGAGLVVLLLVFGVLRPLLQTLMQPVAEGRPGQFPVPAHAGAAGEVRELRPDVSGVRKAVSDRLTQAESEELLLLDSPQSYEKRLDFAQKAIDKDPKRVAQVMKTWMENKNG